MARYILGIDLGTVNSCVAVVRDGRAVVLRDDAQITIPSFLTFHRGKEIVGSAAKRQALADPQATIAAVKRLMGYAFDSPEVQAARRRVSYPIKPSPLGGVLIEVAGKELTPVQVSARILQKIRSVAEEALGESVDRAVISVPAHFTDIQRKATKLAAEYAGLEAVRLLNEPTAAAFAYGYRKGEDHCLAVYDLGGGTFDITVMSARGDRFEVEATDGDAYLGGEDLDYAVAAWLDREFEAQHGHSLEGDDAARIRIKQAAEQAKIELSEREQTQIDLPFLTQLPDGQRPNFSRTLSRAKFEELARPVLERTLEICRRCLQEAGLRPEDVDDALLVGGQTRMPLVRQMVAEFFGREARRDINPDEVVAMGAALYGYQLQADQLGAEAEQAAEESFEIALKETAIARKVIAGVGALKREEANQAQLAHRLEKLLAEAELPAPAAQLPSRGAELPSRGVGLPSRGVGLPTRGPDLPTGSQLPIQLEELRDQLPMLREQAQQALASLREQAATQEVVLEEEEILEFEDDLFDRASQWIGNKLDLVTDASEAASEQLGEAEQHRSARRVDLIDVTSHALGIAAAQDLFSVLIAKNTPVPAEHERTFTTQQDGQEEVEIRVAQGSAQRTVENQSLGSFVLSGIENAPRMQPRIVVTFHIDADGILSVRARDEGTGAEQAIRVEDPLGLQQNSSDAVDSTSSGEEVFS